MALLLQLTQKLAHGFQSAWTIWPRKEAKKDAEKAWKQKVTTPETEGKVFQAFEWQIPMLLEREPQYRPLLASWLRGERWEDEQPAPAKAPLTDEQKRTLARIQSNLPQRGPVNPEIRARLAEEWGQK